MEHCRYRMNWNRHAPKHIFRATHAAQTIKSNIVISEMFIKWDMLEQM